MLSSVVCSAVPHFPTLSHKRNDFRQKTVIAHKMRVSTFSTHFLLNISRSEKNWARCDKKIYIGRHVKCPTFLSDLNKTWIFVSRFPGKTQMLIFIKTHSFPSPPPPQCQRPSFTPIQNKPQNYFTLHLQYYTILHTWSNFCAQRV